MASKIIRVLHIAEKPSAAREITQSLSGAAPIPIPTQTSRFHPVLTFTLPTTAFPPSFFSPATTAGKRKSTKVVGGDSGDVVGGNLEMLFTSVRGHVLELDFPKEFGWGKCDANDLFTAPLQLTPSDKSAYKHLQTLASTATHLVLWLDCDREGEFISHEVASICAKKNRSLEISRARFSAITPTDTFHALKHLTTIDDNLVAAVAARQEIDLRTGAALTRFWTCEVGDKVFNSKPNPVISYGSCQMPTLGLVVQRWWEIEAHKPEPFWRIECTHRSSDSNETNITFAHENGRFTDQETASRVFSKCANLREGTVTDVTTRKTTKRAPLPLHTIELQKLCANKFGLSASAALEIAEDLYAAGMISYPRTQTNNYPPTMDLDALVQIQTSHPQWGKYATKIRNDGLHTPTKGKLNDGAHPPIHPLKCAKPSELHGWEKSVYELIVTHFLASCSSNAVGAETTAKIDVGGESFSTSGLVVLEPNFLEIWAYENWSQRKLPDLKKGDKIALNSVDLLQSATQPPPLLSEADLVTQMSNASIGTDATIAGHIDRIRRRNFVVTKNNRYHPTNLGMAIVCAQREVGVQLFMPHLRAQTEQELEKIAQGKTTKEEVIKQAVTLHSSYLAQMRQSLARLCEVFLQHCRYKSKAKEPATVRNKDDEGNVEEKKKRTRRAAKK